jgi:hypothetical protein
VRTTGPRQTTKEASPMVAEPGFESKLLFARVSQEGVRYCSRGYYRDAAVQPARAVGGLPSYHEPSARIQVLRNLSHSSYLIKDCCDYRHPTRRCPASRALYCCCHNPPMLQRGNEPLCSASDRTQVVGCEFCPLTKQPRGASCAPICPPTLQLWPCPCERAQFHMPKSLEMHAT